MPHFIRIEDLPLNEFEELDFAPLIEQSERSQEDFTKNLELFHRKHGEDEVEITSIAILPPYFVWPRLDDSLITIDFNFAERFLKAFGSVIKKLSIKYASIESSS